MRIEDLIIKVSTDTFNPEYNFQAAVAYENLNQTASAVAFYHRTAEHGYDSHPELAYASLLRISHCFHDQSDRIHTVSNTLLQAIAYHPARPEAYLLLSQFHERNQEWQECYTWASLGLHAASTHRGADLEVDVGYYGDYCFEFQKAVSGWWIGRKDESLALFNKLKYMTLPEEYKVAVENNLRNLDAFL